MLVCVADCCGPRLQGRHSLGATLWSPHPLKCLGDLFGVAHLDQFLSVECLRGRTQLPGLGNSFGTWHDAWRRSVSRSLGHPLRRFWVADAGAVRQARHLAQLKPIYAMHSLCVSSQNLEGPAPAPRADARQDRLADCLLRRWCSSPEDSFGRLLHPIAGLDLSSSGALDPLVASEVLRHAGTVPCATDRVAQPKSGTTPRRRSELTRGGTASRWSRKLTHARLWHRWSTCQPSAMGPTKLR